MFQTEIKFITDFTLNNVKKLGAFFTFEKLLDTNIHPAIKQYINAEFEFLIYEDRQKLIQGSLFDYSGQKINHHFSMIADEIKKTKRVSYEDMKILITRAVSFNISYVLKPNWSLQKLIFGEKKNISIGELELVLNYLYYYDYLKNVFKTYLSKRNIINLSSTEFELILNKIDRELFTSHFEKLVDNSLISIADLFSIGGLNKKIISVEAVEIFLKEKNLIDHLLRLKRTIPAPGKRKYDIDDIRKIIYSATPVEPDTISPLSDDEETEGDFEKVKTLEEAEIKQLTQPEEEPQEDPKSDENIIQELIQDEIVKHDIEEIIEEAGSNDTETVASDDSDDIKSDQEPESISKRSTKKKKKIKRRETQSEKTEENEQTESQQEPDDGAKPEIESATVKEDLNSVEELRTDNISDDTEESAEISTEDIIEETELLSEKDEEELFSFYEDELKDVDENTEGEEEIINIEDFDIQPEIQQATAQDETKNLEKIEIETPDKPLKDRKQPNSETEKIQIEQDDEDKQPETKLKKKRDVFSFLTSKEIDKITDAVFNSDSEDFANTVERISDCQNFDEASEILKSLFISGKISPQSKQAVILTNAVANYFDQV